MVFIPLMPDERTVLDLFSGCGGLSWGLAKSGFRIIGGIDNWSVALTTFKRNHPDAEAINCDLSVVDGPALAERLRLRPGGLDVLVGGPPCQGFSKNVPASRRFLKDDNNLLVRSFLDCVEFLRPKVVLMENVAEIVNAFDGAFTDEICQRLGRCGYRTQVRVLDATKYGVPQRRRRAFFFANRLGKAVQFPVTTHTANGSGLFGRSPVVNVWDAIGDLPRLDAGDGTSPARYPCTPKTEYQQALRRNADLLYDHVARPLRPIQLARLRAIKEGEGAKELPDSLRPKSHYSGAYGRLDKAQIAPTITRWVFHPGSGRFGHPNDDRVITIREAARLQSFSDDFIFTGTYIQKSHQIGNAVPPALSAAFAGRIRSVL